MSDAMLIALQAFGARQFVQEGFVRQVGFGCLDREVLEECRDGGQLQPTQH
jgi:hypothetical protein